jgi:prepilin-type N-terminal cleavage/methylation domain-containing protein
MSRAGNGGFTLLETLVALALVAVALLLGVALVLAQPRMIRRMEAERQAFRAIEGTLEAVRGGAIPLQSAFFQGFDFSAGTPAARNLALWMNVQPVGTVPNLFQVSLRAHYVVAGKGVDKEVDTLVWQPPPEIP